MIQVTPHPYHTPRVQRRSSWWFIVGVYALLTDYNTATEVSGTQGGAHCGVPFLERVRKVRVRSYVCVSSYVGIFG